MTKSSNFLVTILNLEILLNFNLKVLPFTQTNKNTEFDTQFTWGQDLKLMFQISFFF